MATSEDMSYPRSLRRTDQRRGQRDGEQRIPALAEVRRQQQVLREASGQLTVGYQVTLIAELSGELNALFPAYQSTGQAIAREIRQHNDQVGKAKEEVRRADERLGAARAPLTADELRPRNPDEQRWPPERLRDRREVERSRRIQWAQDNLDAARDHIKQRRVERAVTVRRRDEALAAFRVRARHLAELYQRRIATYLDALARSHPDGKTLYPLLSMPEIPLPDWVNHALASDDPITRAGVKRAEEEATTSGAEADRGEADEAEPAARTEDER